MEDGLEHLAGTGSRVSKGRVQERPLSIANAQTDTPEYREYQKLLDENTSRYMKDQIKNPQKYKVSCKAMTRQCMGDAAYEEYIRPKPRRDLNDKPKPPHKTVMPRKK